MRNFGRTTCCLAAVLGVAAASVRGGERGDEEPAESAPATIREARQAIEQSLPYLEKEGVKWMEERKCVSCHQVTSMLWSLNAARSRGFAMDAKKLDRWTQWSAEQMRAQDEDPERVPPVDTVIRLILGRQGYGGPLAKDFEKFPGYLLEQQREHGGWDAAGQLPFQKRPKKETDEATTLWTMLALAATDANATRDRSAAIARSRDRATEWLARWGKTESSAEWIALRMLTEDAFGEKDAAKVWRRKLMASQNEDGGWSFVAGKPSHAVATGNVLYALSRTGVPPGNAAVRGARTFLVRSQREDGTWLTPTTKRPKKDKPADEPTPVSNYWGTAWAVIGLAHTLPEQE